MDWRLRPLYRHHRWADCCNSDDRRLIDVSDDRRRIDVLDDRHRIDVSDDRRRIDVSDHRITRIGDRIDVSHHRITRIGDRIDAVESMSLINDHFFFFDPTVIIFIVISTGHNFEIQTVNSNLTLNLMVNSNINVIFF